MCRRELHPRGLAGRRQHDGGSVLGRVRRGALDGLHDLYQGDNRAACVINHRRENQVNVIRHDYRDPQAIASFVVMDAGCERDVACPLSKNVTKLGVERDEMRRGVALHVGQVATVELH